ncbi:hypothetical protein ACREYJ_10425 [Pseudomonas kribbensis]|uniref:hypothetical protein n=1 Tax=Pseudomonas kribbensis TaxID=1628086 RepID=UPI003D7857CE
MRNLTVERFAWTNSMRVFAACLLSVLLIQPMTASAAEARSTVPDDVSSYVIKRNNCDSLRGDIPEQDPADPDNIHRLASEANKYCKGTDQQLKQLKEKYAETESVLKRLSGYEEHIEADMSQ